MTTYAVLKAKAEELMRQAEEARKSERNEVIAEIKAKIADYELSARDLGFGAAPKKSSKAAGVKYRGPAGETWSGRGRQPLWLSEAVAAGKNKADFLA